MKHILLACAALAVATPGFAQNWGGNITAHYAFGNNSEFDIDGEDGDTIDGPYSAYGVNGSFGYDFGRVALQFDAAYESAEADNHYTFSAYTAHVMMPVGQYTIGAFYGFGDIDHIENIDPGTVSWYGLEAATSFGDNAIAAQLGLSSHTNDHSSLDYNNQFFASAEWRHFVNDSFMIRGTAGFGQFITHGDTGTAYLLAADATFAVARNVYGVVGVREIYGYNAEEGGFNDLSGFVGITMAFGGNGSLRGSMATTPMIASVLPSLTALASSMVD